MSGSSVETEYVATGSTTGLQNRSRLQTKGIIELDKCFEEDKGNTRFSCSAEASRHNIGFTYLLVRMFWCSLQILSGSGRLGTCFQVIRLQSGFRLILQDLGEPSAQSEVAAVPAPDPEERSPSPMMAQLDLTARHYETFYRHERFCNSGELTQSSWRIISETLRISLWAETNPEVILSC